MAEEAQGRERLLRDLRPGERAFNSVAWSPDGTRLAMGSDDRCVYVLTAEGHLLWQGQGYEEIGHMYESALLERTGHVARVWSVAWSPDGRWLASGSDDCSVRLWDSASGAKPRRTDGAKLRRTEHSIRSSEHGDGVRSVAWSADGRWLASGSYDRTVRLWDPVSGTELRCCTGHEGDVNCVAWSADGRWLASGSGDRTVRLWDPANGAELRCCTGHEGNVWSVAWSPVGRGLASGSGDRTVRLWDPASGAELRCCTGHEGDVNCVAWSADGRWLASGSGDHTVRLWDPASGREVALVGRHASVIWAVAFSPDGACLASASQDGSVALWDVTDLV